MTHEIERKFTVKWPLDTILAHSPPVRRAQISQAYFSDSGDWTVRIRQKVCEGEATHYLTMKKRVNNIRCIEMETKITPEFYESMVLQCGPALTKVRYEIPAEDGHLWEVDAFDQPELDGLVLAEIELSDEDTTFQMPEWADTDVSDKKRYKNARLVKRLSA